MSDSEVRFSYLENIYLFIFSGRLPCNDMATPSKISIYSDKQEEEERGQLTWSYWVCYCISFLTSQDSGFTNELHQKWQEGRKHLKLGEENHFDAKISKYAFNESFIYKFHKFGHPAPVDNRRNVVFSREGHPTQVQGGRCRKYCSKKWCTTNFSLATKRVFTKFSN